MRLLWGLPLLVFSCALAAAEHSTIDAHLHAVDFFQESEGVSRLIDCMDEGNISHSVVLGIPVAKKWHEDEPEEPRYYAGDDASVYWYSATDFWVHDFVEQADEDERERLIPFLSGFNPTDKHAADYIRRLLDHHPDFWQGIGEVFLRHDDLTALTQGDTPRADSEAMMKVYRVAADHDLPVLLHSNITSKREHKPLYLEELEKAVKDNPDVDFIWAHAGTSKEIHRHQGKLDFLHETVERLLEEYDNLYIDLSWTVLEPYLLDEDGKPRDKWVDLVEKYPDRFTIGSDVVGKFKSQPKIMQDFEPFLEALDDDTADKVASENILSLVPARHDSDDDDD